MLRSKIAHIEENEIEISELARLEKRRADENLIYALQDNEGVLQEGTENVRDIVYEYYKDVYRWRRRWATAGWNFREYNKLNNPESKD